MCWSTIGRFEPVVDADGQEGQSRRVSEECVREAAGWVVRFGPRDCR